MKLRILLEDEKTIPLKQRLLKFQQDLIDICEDVSPLDVFKLPYSSLSCKTTYNRYVFIVTGARRGRPEHQYAIFIDDCGEDLISVDIYTSKKLGEHEVHVDSTTVKTLQGLLRLFGFDEMSTGRQEGLDQALVWLDPL